ncbi:hypothetical protein AGMMS50249_1390 [candidate division SR1 bacterium]|nr:hypothetical protein AGMMS50249_1390 [candidate division SR1 bacterium]
MPVLKHLLSDYGTQLKYLLLFLLLIIGIFTIKIYVNYLTIINTVVGIDEKNTHVQNDMNYSQYFQSAYLASDYGHLFLAHDNNIVFWGETIISFNYPSSQKNQVQELNLNHIPNRQQTQEQERMDLNPRDARKVFLDEKI